jgi:hypothetical protein
MFFLSLIFLMALTLLFGKSHPQAFHAEQPWEQRLISFQVVALSLALAALVFSLAIILS